MTPQPSQSLLDSHGDTELECLLFLAAAVQARERAMAKPQSARAKASASSLLSRLQTLWKALRKADRHRAA